jgi:type II secretory pathway pseudopilin PulG
MPTAFLIYAIIPTELQSRRQRREWEQLQAVQVALKQVRLAEREQQRQSAIQERGYDSPQGFYDDCLKRLKHNEKEIRQYAEELRKTYEPSRDSVTIVRRPFRSGLGKLADRLLPSPLSLIRITADFI